MSKAGNTGKGKGVSVFLSLLVIGIYNLVFFLKDVPDMSTSLWVSYGFVHLAFIMVIVSIILPSQSKERETYTATNVMVSSIYYFVEMAFSIVILFMQLDMFKLTLVIHCILFAAFLFVWVPGLFTQKLSDELDLQRVHGENYVKQCGDIIQTTLSVCTDRDAVKKLERLYGIVKASPVKGNDSTSQLENTILNELTNLLSGVKSLPQQEVFENIEQLVRMVESRNRMLK